MVGGPIIKFGQGHNLIISCVPSWLCVFRQSLTLSGPLFPMNTKPAYFTVLFWGSDENPDLVNYEVPSRHSCCFLVVLFWGPCVFFFLNYTKPLSLYSENLTLSDLEVCLSVWISLFLSTSQHEVLHMNEMQIGTWGASHSVWLAYQLRRSRLCMFSKIHKRGQTLLSSWRGR